MDNKNNLENLKSILSRKKTKTPPAYEWQDLALRVIQELAIPRIKRNSVFKVCKAYPKPFIEKCLNDTKELCQSGECWRYFFKLVSGKKNNF